MITSVSYGIYKPCLVLRSSIYFSTKVTPDLKFYGIVIVASSLSYDDGFEKWDYLYCGRGQNLSEIPHSTSLHECECYEEGPLDGCYKPLH